MALVFGLAGSAYAQLGVYGMATGQRFSGVTCPSFASPCASNDGVVRPYGGTFGIYYDFKNLGPVRIGADVRSDVLTSNKRADSSAGGEGILRAYNTLGGLRGSFRTPIHWLHPYAEIAGGYSRNNSIGQYTITSNALSSVSQVNFNPAIYSNYTLVKGFVGLDVAIFPFLDLRAIELGEGEAFGSAANVRTVNSDGSVSQTFSPSTHGTQSIGAGLVLHLPR